MRVVSGPSFVAERSTLVGVSRERLFDLLENDGMFLELRPGAIAHRDVISLENGGHACTQDYEANGHRFTQTCRATRFERIALA